MNDQNDDLQSLWGTLRFREFTIALAGLIVAIIACAAQFLA